MIWYAGLEEIVERDKPLAPLTWFNLGGPAQFFVTPRDRQELADVVRRCRENGLPLHVLGHGANVLVADRGVDGAVIHLGHAHFRQININQEDGYITAAAGMDLGKLIPKAIRAGLAGMECLAGIPSSVGGAVRMNAGGRFGDVGGICERVTVMDADGFVFDRTKGDLVFGYRHSNLAGTIVLEAVFRLGREDPDKLLRTFREIWMYKKNSQPLAAKSAGCIFKNPRQLSAGALIDQAGLKGARVGGAQVSERHANFIVHEPGCKTSDVLELIRVIRRSVADRFGVQLELEIDVW